ncbi:MAG: DUF6491 family protein [Hyphomonadaceae bacterium]
MKKILTIFSTLFALWTLAACASSADGSSGQSASARDCFRSEQASGYSIIDDHTVSVRVGASRNYLFRTNWNARDLDWTQAIALRSSTGLICTGNGLGVSIIGGNPQRSYPVHSIDRAPGDEAPQGS